MNKPHAMHNASASGIWLDCSLHYHFKKDALEGSLDVEWDTSGEAARRGTIQHDVSEHALKYIMGGLDTEEAVDRAIRKVKRKLTKEERGNVIIAMHAILDLITPSMNVEREAEVPLSHEPESNGYIDVAGFEPGSHLLVADYKYGQMAVSPNAPQLKTYAANLIEYLRRKGHIFEPDFEVKLAIIQPKLHREALVRVMRVGELDAFRHYVDGVVLAQTDGHDRRGAGSLKTCEWCPMSKAGCFHKTNLVSSMLADLKTPVTIADHVIEEITKSRSAMKKVIDECAATVAGNPKRFPNWTRVDVSNGRKWNALLEASEIESQLIDGGAKDLHTLKTPAQVRDENPSLDNLVDKLSAEQGHHVRLYPGAPKGAPRVEPTKRASAKRATPSKKSARKKAAKKTTSKKKARKKNARKVRRVRRS